MSTKVMERQNEKNRNKIRTMAQIGMLSAIATVLMLFEIPLPFAPSFYEIDFSEVPILIGSFAMGPLAGAAIELIKILLNFAINGTMTAGVGEIYQNRSSSRNGSGNRIHDSSRMFPECLRITTGICQSIRYADRRPGWNGNCRKQTYHRP